MTKHFGDELAAACREKNSVLCVGLDPELARLPARFIDAARRQIKLLDFGQEAAALELFCKHRIDVVAPYVAAVKPNAAFFERYGAVGLLALQRVIAHAKGAELLTVTDAKRGDGGPTAAAYAEAHIGEVFAFDPKGAGLIRVASPLNTDAVTVDPYIGDACLEPFVKATKANGTGIFVVTRTSFKPISHIEELVTTSGMKVWEEVANQVGFWSNHTALGESGYYSVGAVLGATYPQDAPTLRRYLRQHWFLVPGYGAQGGGADDAVKAANADGLGVLVNSSRGIIYAANPAAAARTARDELNAALARAGKPIR